MFPKSENSSKLNIHLSYIPGSDSSRENTRLIIIGLILLLLPIIVTVPILLSGHTLLPHTDLNGMLGLKILVGKLIATGNIPFWDPYLLSDQSLIATQGSGVLYPFNWLFAFISPMIAANVFIIIHYQIALIGCFVYGCRIGMGIAGSVFFAVSFVFGALNVLPSIGIGNSTTIAAAIWIPWIFLSIEKISLICSWRWVILGSVFISLQLFTGDPHISLVTFIICIAYTIYNGRLKQNKTIFYALTGAFLICGLLISIVQIIPIREMLILKNKTLFTIDQINTDSKSLFDRLFIIIFFSTSILCAAPFVLKSKKLSARFWIITALIASMMAGMLYETHESVTNWIPVYYLFYDIGQYLYFAGFAGSIIVGFLINIYIKSFSNLGIRERLQNYFWGIPIIALSIIAIVTGIAANSTNDNSDRNSLSILHEPKAIKYITAQENNLNSFRVIKLKMSSTNNVNIPDTNWDNIINNSSAWGIRSVNGRKTSSSSERFSNALGGFKPDGTIENASFFNLKNTVADLLSVKYLILNDYGSKNSNSRTNISGIPFTKDPVNLMINRNETIDIKIPSFVATELVLISNLGNSFDIENNKPVLEIILRTKDGKIIKRELLAGRDTGEWSYHDPSLSRKIKHQKPIEAFTFPANGFQGAMYISRLPFERSEITEIEFKPLFDNSQLLLDRISLQDTQSGLVNPITNIDLLTHHYNLAAKFDNIHVYEKKKPFPQAWFVQKVTETPGSEALNIIKSGYLSNGYPFNPLETAIVDQESVGFSNDKSSDIGIPINSKIDIKKFEPNKLEIRTENQTNGFLVLSEPYARGWSAFVDGKRVALRRVNYLLQGIELSSGNHKVEFIYQHNAVSNGLLYTIAGILTMLLGAVVSKFWIKRSQLISQKKLEGR